MTAGQLARTVATAAAAVAGYALVTVAAADAWLFSSFCAADGAAADQQGQAYAHLDGLRLQVT